MSKNDPQKIAKDAKHSEYKVDLRQWLPHKKPAECNGLIVVSPIIDFDEKTLAIIHPKDTLFHGQKLNAIIQYGKNLKKMGLVSGFGLLYYHHLNSLAFSLTPVAEEQLIDEADITKEAYRLCATDESKYATVEDANLKLLARPGKSLVHYTYELLQEDAYQAAFQQLHTFCQLDTEEAKAYLAAVNQFADTFLKEKYQFFYKQADMGGLHFKVRLSAKKPITPKEYIKNNIMNYILFENIIFYHFAKGPYEYDILFHNAANPNDPMTEAANKVLRLTLSSIANQLFKNSHLSNKLIWQPVRFTKRTPAVEPPINIDSTTQLRTVFEIFLINDPLHRMLAWNGVKAALAPPDNESCRLVLEAFRDLNTNPLLKMVFITAVLILDQFGKEKLNQIFNELSPIPQPELTLQFILYIQSIASVNLEIEPAKKSKSDQKEGKSATKNPHSRSPLVDLSVTKAKPAEPGQAQPRSKSYSNLHVHG